MNMNIDLKNLFDKKLHMSRLRVLSRRATAGALSLAILTGTCGMLTPAAYATNVAPTKQHVNVGTNGDPDGTGEGPTITVEANAVVDGDGLTGFVEVALRVRPGVLYYDITDPGNPVLLDGRDAADALIATGGEDVVDKVIQPFNTLAVALRYNSRLTPWEWVDEDPNWDNPNAETAVEVVRKGTGLASKQMTPISHAGSAYLNTVDARVSDYKNSDFGGYLYFEVKNNTPRELDPDEDWVLGVVRFKYELDETNSNNNPLATNVDSAKWVTPGNPDCLFQFVDPADIFDVAYTTIPLWECYYDGENNDFYYTAERDPETGKPSYGMEAPDPALGGADPDIMTNNLLELNNDHTDVGKVEPGKINFTLVNHITYNIAARGMTTLLFYDWDDELLGAQAVLPNRDVQEQVNSYVKEKLIHPDIAANIGTTYQSIARADSYRGRYPYSGPAGADSEKRSDGEDYPLTYKLDYTFFKRNMVLNDTDPDNPIWEQDTTNAWNADYPLTEGWALCSRKTIRDTWTTLGVGELSDYAVTAGVDDAKFTVADGMAFTFADFATGFSGSETYVKAVYEPGDGLIYNDYSSDPDNVKYIRYGYMDSATVGSAYGIQFQYERISSESGWGVQRARDPAVRLSYTVDEEGVEGKTFYLRIAADNVDLIDVEFTPAGTLLSLEYALADQYNADFFTGADRSAFGNLQNLPTDFDYEEYPNHPDRLGTPGFVINATLRQILVQAAKAYGPDGTSANVSELTTSILTVATMGDLNYKFGSQELGSTTFDIDNNYIAIVRNKLEKLFQAAYQAGLVKTFIDPTTGKEKEELDLEWHQIQYHILTSDLSGNGGAIVGNTVMTEQQCIAAYGDMSWCKLHGMNGSCTTGNVSGGTELEIDNWADLLNALNAAPTNPKALNKLTIAKVNTLFYLAADAQGTPYTSADLATLKTTLTAAVSAANLPSYETNYANLTWPEVQYYLINGSYPSAKAVADTTAEGGYWWVNGGTKVTNVATLLPAVDRASSGLTTPDGVAHSTWEANLKTAASPTGDPMSTITNDPLRLRQSQDGDPDDGTVFANVAAFESAIKTLVAAAKAADSTNWDSATDGLGNWDILQYYLIHHTGSDPYPAGGVSAAKKTAITNEATSDYWWKYGDAVTDWPTFLKAAAKAVDPTDPTEQLLNTLPVANASGAPYELRKDALGNEFATQSDFNTAVKAVAQQAQNNGDDFTDATLFTNEVVQYLLDQYEQGTLGSAYSGSVSSLTAAVTARRDAKYWWMVGDKQPVTDLTSLLDAAQKAYGTDGTDGVEAKLSSIDLKGIPMDFSKDFEGNLYSNTSDSDKAAFQAKMKAMVGVANAASVGVTAMPWEHIQYYLIHNQVDPLNYAAEAQGSTANNGYYWWAPASLGWTTVNNPVAVSTDTPIATGGNFDPTSTAAQKILWDGMFRAEINKNPNTWNNLQDSNVADLRLISGFASGKSLADAEADADLVFSTAANLKTTLGTLAPQVVPDFEQNNSLSSISNNFGYTASNKRITLDWYVYQYALLNGGALPTNAQYLAAKDDYWWLEKDNKNTSAGTPQLDAIMEVFNNFIRSNPGGTSANANTLKGQITDDMVKNLGLSYTTAGATTANTTNLTKVKTALGNIYRAIINNNNSAAIADNGNYGYDYTTKTLHITWYQVQYLTLNMPNPTSGKLPDPVSAYNYVMANPKLVANIPSWVPKLPNGDTADGSHPGVDAPTALGTTASLDSYSFQLMQDADLLNPVEEVHEDIVTEEKTTSEDGLSETTTVTTKTYNEEVGEYETHVVVTTISKTTTGVTTTVVTTVDVVFDPETWLPVTTTHTQTSVEEPEIPAEAEKPAETVKPEETETPEETKEPEETEPPAETEKPEKTEEPTEPETPEETKEPEETEEPTEPEKPEETEHPTEPEEPKDPEEPDNSDISNPIDEADKTDLPNKTEETDKTEGSPGATDPPEPDPEEKLLDPGGMATARALRKITVRRRFSEVKLRCSERSPGEIIGPYKGILTAIELFDWRNTSSGRTLS